MATGSNEKRLAVDQRHAAIEQAVSAFGLLRDYFEGAIAVDAEARITWIDKRYRELLKLDPAFDPVGLPVEDVIPQSLMRRVVETGRPTLLDIMNFGDRRFVVCRIPLKDGAGRVDGALGFVFYDKVEYLEPILAKFAALQSQLRRAQAALTRERQTKYSLSSFVGFSDAVKELKAQVRRYALRDGAALISGETGTGKELLAHGIHAASPRAGGPFVSVNIAAVPDTLLEAEFFGVAPGAYTGADRKGRVGKFQLANGGTLFLDEIGDMPAHLQAKLLRALQEGEIEPLGSNQLIPVDVRVLAATSRDLPALVKGGQFREDLFYRLHVLPLRVPPLRARRGDIPALVEALYEDLALRSNAAPPELLPDALALLAAQPWRGNIRELRNVLEQAAMRSDGPSINAAQLARVLQEAGVELAAPAAAAPVSGVSGIQGEADAVEDADASLLRPLAEQVAALERRAIAAALHRHQGNKLAAARALGISRATLYARLMENPE